MTTSSKVSEETLPMMLPEHIRVRMRESFAARKMVSSRFTIVATEFSEAVVVAYDNGGRRALLQALAHQG